MPPQTTTFPLTLDSLRAICAKCGLPGAVVKAYGFGNDDYAKVYLLGNVFDATVHLTDGLLYNPNPGLLNAKSIETWLDGHRAMFAQAIGL